MKAIREVTEGDFVVQMDLGEQILGLDAPDDEQFTEPELSPTPPSSTGLVSASVLSQKAKQFNDALYAAVELAAQGGAGDFPSKIAFFRAWAEEARRAGESGEAARVLFAACELGEAGRLSLPDRITAEVQEEIQRFLADERRSTPLGFYTERRELTAIFQQDRMLMTELRDSASAEALAQLVTANSGLHEDYRRILSLARKMTNPPGPEMADLLRQGKTTSRRILTPSRSPESDLVLRLFGNRPIPDGFDLAEEIARQVENGTISLAPRDDSGWYDHQVWALEPLVAPERTAEASRLHISAEYRRHLRELFKGILALTRETHVKQLEPPLCGAAADMGPVPIYVQPGLTTEPLATYYLRRAGSYRFVRRVLEDEFGTAWRDIPFEQVLSSPRRIDESLESMEALFHGAHARTCRELGTEPDGSLLPDRDPDRDDGAFRSWAEAPGKDPDLAADSRMMVPVFYDIVRRRMKVWALLGWSRRPVTIDFHQPPRLLAVARKQPAGRLEELRRRLGGGKANQPMPEVRFIPAYHSVAFPVTAEIYVDRLLDRREFRRLCDRRRTRTAILAEIER